MSLAVFGGLASSLGLGIQVTADPAAASPSQTLALFETNEFVNDTQVRTARPARSGRTSGRRFPARSRP
jgi:hypothetical protein